MGALSIGAVSRAAPSLEPRPGRRRGHLARAALLYALLALGFFALPLGGDLSHRLIARDDLDPSLLIWMLAWWPHALTHGLNPLLTHAIFYPEGYNLAWATSMPLPAVLLAPITLTAGPVLSYNLLSLLCPALSAWTAYLLARELTGRTVPSLVAGYLFGFSPYVIGHLETSPNLAMVALVPVAVLLCVRRLRGELPARRFVIALTATLVAQFLISTEVLLTGALFGLIALGLGALLGARGGRELGRLLGTCLLAALAAAVLVSPYLYVFITGPHYPPTATGFSSDLLTFVLPRGVVALGTSAGPALPHAGFEGYLGLPLIAIVLLATLAGRGDRGTRLLAAAFAAAVIASLGSPLWVAGHRTGIPLPWAVVSGLPVLRYVLPARLIVFAVLPAALLAARILAGLDRPPVAARRWADRRGARVAAATLVVLAVVVIVPAVGTRSFNTPIADPPFFARGLYARVLHRGDHLLTIPALGPGQRWLADAGFPVDLSTGSGGQGLPASFTRYPVWDAMIAFPYRLPADYPAALRRFLAAKRVTVIVVANGVPGPWVRLFGSLRIVPRHIGGVTLYRVSGSTG